MQAMVSPDRVRQKEKTMHVCVCEDVLADVSEGLK